MKDLNSKIDEMKTLAAEQKLHENQLKMASESINAIKLAVTKTAAKTVDPEQQEKLKSVIDAAKDADNKFGHDSPEARK
jgi:hypothetical protein